MLREGRAAVCAGYCVVVVAVVAGELVMDAAEAFAVLDLKPGASAAEIEAAYKAAVKAWHPDRFNHSPEMRDVAEAKLRRLNEAYELVTNAAPDGGQASSPDDEAEYIDEQIVYVGHDPRLPPISGPYSKGRPGIVSVCPRGVALLVGDDPNDPAPMQYPVESLQCLSREGRTWLAESIETPGLDLSGQKPEQCSLVVNDPNGIEKYIRVELRFRNAYHAKLFVRRSFALMRLPVPKPATPTPASVDSASAGNQAALLVLALIIILLAAALMVVAAAANGIGNGHQKSAPPSDSEHPSISQGSFSIKELTWSGQLASDPRTFRLRIQFPDRVARAQGNYSAGSDLSIRAGRSDKNAKSVTAYNYYERPSESIANGWTWTFFDVPGSGHWDRIHVEISSGLLQYTQAFDIVPKPLTADPDLTYPVPRGPGF